VISRGVIQMCGSDYCTKTPTLVANQADIVAISLGGSNACGLKKDTSIVCWADDESFTRVGSTTLSYVAQLGVGEDHSCAVETDREVECWGQNDHGQLGNGYVDAPFSGTDPPQYVKGLADVVQVAVAWASTCALLSDGTVSREELVERQLPRQLSRDLLPLAARSARPVCRVGGETPGRRRSLRLPSFEL
jgi:hypothetical protein